MRRGSLSLRIGNERLALQSTSTRAPLPRAPVLDWSSFKRSVALHSTCIDDAPNKAFTTSGRAALYHALRQLRLPAGTSVLVPTYHCPTMVAPVICAGLTPVFFGLRDDGLPNLDAIGPATAQGAGAIIVAHYFGLGRCLAAVRNWCDQHDVALIEDCAHCFFGLAGDRPVGHWGDFATASLSKFFPVPEAGVLTSTKHTVAPLALDAPRLRAQMKGWVDVLEVAVRHDRLGGLSRLLNPIFGLKNRASRNASAGNGSDSASALTMMQLCDMARVEEAPLAVSMMLNQVLPRGHVAARRRENFDRYAGHFFRVDGARPAFATMPGAQAPYVFPLWVDDAERVYTSLRTRRFPVFRWDRTWPGTPVLPGDVGPLWSRHILQLLCHQDLSTADIDATASAVIDHLQISDNAQ